MEEEEVHVVPVILLIIPFSSFSHFESKLLRLIAWRSNNVLSLPIFHVSFVELI